MQKDRTYVCIDLKSFYASVECRERGLDPMTTNLVVADPERSDKTICLAVSPAMKKLGVPGRCRVFEIPKGIEYIMAPPRMQLYIDYSAEIYAIYLKYISKEDIHVYSIDEVFMDVTDYLAMYQMSAKELSVRIMEDILEHTGITATAGIGTNLYLAKVALDITAKHVEDHIGILDRDYQDYSRQMKELCEKYPAIIQLIDGNNGVTLNDEEYQVFKTYSELSSNREMLERAYYYYFGQADMFHYQKLLKEISETKEREPEQRKKEILECMRQFRLEEAEKEFRFDPKYQKERDEVFQYEQELRSMGLSEEIITVIDNYLCALNAEWLRYGELAYQYGMEDILAMIKE